MFETVLAPQPSFRQRPRSLLLSVSLHALAVLALFAIRFPPSAKNIFIARQQAVLIAPAPQRPPAPVRPRIAPPPRPVPRPFHALAAPVLPPRVALDLPPAPVIETPRPMPPVTESRIPAAPPPPLKTNNLTPALPEIPAPAPRASIQAAGFSGAEAAESRAPREALARLGSFGETAPEPQQRPPAPAIAKGGFGDASVAAPQAPRTTRADIAAAAPVEILFKPRPEYTAEARRLRIEGEVLVELLFAASGEARVLRVVRGLGHGLDETAVRAAEAIRFRPAQRAGVPADSSAVVHIVFQLAY